jgi:hypothetical protein
MVRKTASFQLYAQQFGRGLRVMAPGFDHRLHEFTDEQRLRIIADSPKPHALILDHVGNFLHFASKGQIVDAPQEYSLARRVSERGGNADGVMPYKICYACAQPFEAYRTACPWCGTERVPMGRGSPEAVDGDLIELDGAVLAQLRGEIKRVDGIQLGPKYIQHAHLDRQRAQASLRKIMRLWGGWREHAGDTERESHKRFFLMFGVDVLTAQTLGSPEAAALEARVAAHLSQHNIVEAA